MNIFWFITIYAYKAFHLKISGPLSGSVINVDSNLENYKNLSLDKNITDSPKIQLYPKDPITKFVSRIVQIVKFITTIEQSRNK